MKPDGWERFLRHAAYVRRNPRFEAEERGRSLAVAKRVLALLDAARAGDRLGPHLEALFALLSDPGRPYFLIALFERDWLEAWQASDEASLREALISFHDSGPGSATAFARFAQAVGEAEAGGIVGRQVGAAMAFGSLLNFAAAPELLPVVRVNPYTRVEQMLGHDPPDGGTIVDRYQSHLAFARRLQEELVQAGIEAQDMIDVQGLIFTTAVALAREALWTEEELPAGVPRDPDRNAAYLAVCSCLGYDAPYLLEWLEFHRLAGVERFFLYNNGDREAQRELLEPYVEAGLVVLHDWPIFPPQVPAARHCLETHRKDSRWIAFFDTDEFLFSPTGRPLPELLTEYERWPGVGVNLAVFGPSGHHRKPAGLVVESYVERLPNKHIKSIVDPARTLDCATPHQFVYEDGFAADENGHPIVGARSPYLSFSRLRINHYYTKSEAEFRAKWTRNRPDSGAEREEPEFASTVEALTRFGETDRDILQYVPKLRESLSRIDRSAGRL